MNGPAIARRRAFLVAALAAGAAMLAAGCSIAAPSAPAGASATPSTGTASAPATSPSPPASPSPTLSPTPSPSLPASLPSGWQSCTNSHAGYEIGYPAGWYTAELNPQQACQQFHPVAFTIPIDGEYPLTALNAVQTPEVFDPDRSGTVDSSARTLLREATTVGGRRAVRFEWSLVEEGLYPVGTMRYGYVIDRDGLEFTVFTMAVPAEGGYSDWKPIVDQAVETLRFLGS
jgi:hypothetical protein